MRHRWLFKRKRQRLITWLSVLCFAASLAGYALLRCRPVMTAFAESQAVWVATKVANQTVAEVLLQYAQVCDEAISITYDGENRVSAVRADTVTVNTVRTAVTNRAIEKMEELSSLSVTLPFGTLIGWDWLSGLGPFITVPISFTATILSDATSSLQTEGINQSVYQVLIHLEIQLYVVSPAGRSTVGVRMSYPIAEAVLLGEVPDNLTEVYGDDQSLLGQIFDYGTTQ